jgi:glycerol-3-phosphate dehydrogenase
MQRRPDALRDETFDLLVVGGGITGAGVALDAALRGLRVALIDKGDFAVATSSASSKLVHGGLRYLEHGSFRLVYEALHERAHLLHNAPHLVRPLRFLIPFVTGARLASWQWRAGLALYDLLAGQGNLRRSRPLSVKELARECPALRTDSLTGGAAYYDAQMDDARLCLEVVRTAAQEGACVANYVELIAFELVNGQIAGVRVHDHLAGQEIFVRARQVVNATGPWVDQVCRLAGDHGAPRLRPTKGVHLVLPGQGLRSALLLLHPRDGRVFFVIPWRVPPAEDAAIPPKTLVGTTDTTHDGPPETAGVEAADIAYLLDGYNHYFNPARSEADILGTLVGLRPLVASRPGKPSSRSREFALSWSPSGLLSVAGGKYTTYRHMAEVITDAVVRRLGRKARCRTRDLRLDGAPAGDWEVFATREATTLAYRYHLPLAAARHLVGRYGRRAADVAAYLHHDPELGKPVVPGEPDLLVEFSYQRDHEMAVYPADHLLRRTRLGLFRPDLLQTPILPRAARSAAEGALLGRSASS